MIEDGNSLVIGNVFRAIKLVKSVVRNCTESLVFVSKGGCNETFYLIVFLDLTVKRGKPMKTVAITTATSILIPLIRVSQCWQIITA